MGPGRRVGAVGWRSRGRVASADRERRFFGGELSDAGFVWCGFGRFRLVGRFVVRRLHDRVVGGCRFVLGGCGVLVGGFAGRVVWWWAARFGVGWVGVVVVLVRRVVGERAVSRSGDGGGRSRLKEAVAVRTRRWRGGRLRYLAASAGAGGARHRLWHSILGVAVVVAVVGALLVPLASTPGRGLGHAQLTATTGPPSGELFSPSEWWGGGNLAEHCAMCISGTVAAVMTPPTTDPAKMVNTATGDLSDSYTLFAVPDQGGELNLTLTYDAQGPTAGSATNPLFGLHWTDNWNSQIVSAAGQGYSGYDVVESNGSVDAFADESSTYGTSNDCPSGMVPKNPSNAGSFCADPRVDATLATTSSSGFVVTSGTSTQTYSYLGSLQAEGSVANPSAEQITTNIAGPGPDGCRGGYCEAMTDAAGRYVTIQYDCSTQSGGTCAGTQGGEATAVYGPGGEQYTFPTPATQTSPTLAEIEGPATSADAGPAWKFGYSSSVSGQLASITDPDGNQTTYAFNANGTVETANQVGYTYSDTCASGDEPACLGSNDSRVTTVTEPDGQVDTYSYYEGVLQQQTVGTTTTTSPFYQKTTYGYTNPAVPGGNTTETITSPTNVTTAVTDEVGNVLSKTVRAAAGVTLSYTGSLQTYTVPAGVTSVAVDASGAQGGTGDGGSAGGEGGEVVATVPVTPGEVLDAVVGGAGASAATTADSYGGGGTDSGSASFGGAGGGGTYLYSGSSLTQADVLVAAGGGGGGGYDSTGVAGGAGGDPGTAGNGYSAGASGGAGGTQAAGGAGGTAVCASSTAYGGTGTTFTGGNGGVFSGLGSGGGGGGYFGGGGGCNDLIGGGGGGGSSYANAAATGVAYMTGVRSGNGQLVISPSILQASYAAYNSFDEPCWTAPAGVAIPSSPTCSKGPAADSGATFDTYDSAGDLLTQTDPEGNVTTYGYDQYGQRCWQAAPGVTVPTGASCADPPPGSTHVSYDADGNVVSSSTPDGLGTAYASDTTTATYDEVGQITSLTPPDGNVGTVGWQAGTAVGQRLDSVSCPSTDFCVAASVDSAGEIYTYNGSTWSAATNLGSRIAAVTCVSSTFCMAVSLDAAGEVASGPRCKSTTGVGSSRSLVSRERNPRSCPHEYHRSSASAPRLTTCSVPSASWARCWRRWLGSGCGC